MGFRFLAMKGETPPSLPVHNIENTVTVDILITTGTFFLGYRLLVQSLLNSANCVNQMYMFIVERPEKCISYTLRLPEIGLKLHGGPNPDS